MEPVPRAVAASHEGACDEVDAKSGRWDVQMELCGGRVPVGFEEPLRGI